MARREKKPVHKVVMTEGKRNIIQQLLQEYDIETAEENGILKSPSPKSTEQYNFTDFFAFIKYVTSIISITKIL